MAELLTALSLDANQNITAIWFLNELGETFGRKTTKESPIVISAGNKLLALLQELYCEYSDGYETSHKDPLVTRVKVKWEGQNPIKCDLSIIASSTKFGSYAIALESPETTHITNIDSLIKRISNAALKEYIDYDKYSPAYAVYEQPSLFQALPDLSLETVAA